MVFSQAESSIWANLNIKLNIWPSPTNRQFVIYLYIVLHYSCHISNVHSFHVALFSYYTFSILHFSCIPHVPGCFFNISLFSCYIFFIMDFSIFHSFMLLSSLLHSFQVLLFSVHTFFMLNVLLVLLCKDIKRLTLSWRRPLSYRKQSIDLLCKSMNWYLYDNGLRHERVKFALRI